MGLLQQEFFPVLQPSIQTADRYHTDTPAHSVLFVDMSYRPWISALRSSVPFFHALLIFLICSAFLGKPSGCNIVNISYFFHKLPVFLCSI